MNKPLEISDYYEALCASFFLHLKKAGKLKKKTIHKLRVDVKQIRAVAELAPRLSKNFPYTSTLNALKPLYSAAGKQRTLIINIKLVKDFSFPQEIESAFNKQLEKDSRKLIKAIKSFDTKSFKSISKEGVKALKKTNNERGNTQILLQSKKTLNELKLKLKQKHISDRQLHDIRKKLKLVKTNLDLLIHLNAADKLYKALFSKIVSAETTIGEWHDKAVLYESLLVASKKLVLTRASLSAMVKLREINLKEKAEAINDLKGLF